MLDDIINSLNVLVKKLDKNENCVLNEAFDLSEKIERDAQEVLIEYLEKSIKELDIQPAFIKPVKLENKELIFDNVKVVINKTIDIKIELYYKSLKIENEFIQSAFEEKINLKKHKIIKLILDKKLEFFRTLIKEEKDGHFEFTLQNKTIVLSKENNKYIAMYYYKNGNIVAIYNKDNVKMKYMGSYNNDILRTSIIEDNQTISRMVSSMGLIISNKRNTINKDALNQLDVIFKLIMNKSIVEKDILYVDGNNSFYELENLLKLNTAI